MGETALRWLPAGASVLDFGAGPCDKAAVLTQLGYQCSAYDDLQDAWHLHGDNRDRIRCFARESDIDFRLATTDELPWTAPTFDMVLLLAVIEHFHDSPRKCLLSLLEVLKPAGYIVITVPNAVNLRKRLDVLRGHTNLPPYENYYWSSRWRGHVREYVKRDLQMLAQFLGLTIVELRSYHQMLDKLPARLRPMYRAATAACPGGRDSWLLVARKPEDWRAQPASKNLIPSHGEV